MEVVSHTLLAGARTRIHHPGRFFVLIETTAPLDVTFERNGSPIGETGNDVEAGYKRFPGDWSDPDDGSFETVVLTSATAQTVVLGISQSAGDYSRIVSVVETKRPSGFKSQADRTVNNALTSIISANVNRTAVLIQNLHPTISIRIGQNATATSGFRLQPGQSVVLEATDGINGFAESGTADVSVSYEQLT